MEKETRGKREKNAVPITVNNVCVALTSLLYFHTRSALIPRFVLVHGDFDATVPVDSSHEFAAALNNFHVNVQLHTFADLSHADCVLELMFEDSKFTGFLLAELGSCSR